MPRPPSADVAARLAPAVLATVLVACGTTPNATPAATRPPNPTPAPVGAGLGLLPGVEGFAYRIEPGIAPGFVDGATESLDGAAEVEIVQATVASRGDEEVSVIAFGFPAAADDTQAVDYFARIVDGMEDGFQAGAERGLDGKAYVMTSEGQSVVLAPWGRTDYLLFLFLFGPTEAATDLAATLLITED